MMEQWLSFIPDSMVQALGWMIIHSFWQAGVLGMLYLLVRRVTSTYQSYFRYSISLLTLSSITILAFATFIFVYQDHMPANIVSRSGGLASSLLPRSMMNHEVALNWKNILSDQFHLLFILWSLGVMFFSSYTAAGMLAVHRIRSKSMDTLPYELDQRIAFLANKLGISRHIRIRVSYDIWVPLVTGIFKPVILVPAGLISGFPVAQLESVMIHELLHIRRFDSLVNMFQRAAEIIFFYHPVVWMISRQIRIEREHCCDDKTIEIARQPISYAKALAAVSEYSLRRSSHIVAFADHNRVLYKRINRMLKQKKMKNNMHSRMTAGIMVLAVILVISVSTGINQPEEPYNMMGADQVINLSSMFPATNDELRPLNNIIPQSMRVMIQDTSLNIKNNIVTKTIQHDDGTKENIEMHVMNGKVMDIFVDGQKVPADEYDQYADLIRQTKSELKHMRKKLQHARQELEQIDIELLKDHIAEVEIMSEAEMNELKQELAQMEFNMQDMQMNMDSIRGKIEQNLQEIHVDRVQMQQELEKALQEAQNSMQEINLDSLRIDMQNAFSETEMMHKMQEEIEKALREIQKFDQEAFQNEMERINQELASINYEQMQKEIARAMQELESLDMREIQREVQKAMQELMDGRHDIERSKKEMDDLLEELEKLELDEQ